MLIKKLKLKLTVVLTIASLLPNASYSDEGFKLSTLKKVLEKEISQKVNREKITIKNASLNRKDSNKFFSISDISNLKIKDSYKIETLEIKESNSSFNSVITPSEGDVKIMVKGTYIDSVKIPVLSSNIRKGTEITQDDLSFKYVSKKEVRRSSVTNITEIIGLVAKRNLTKDKVISFRDIEREVLIKKNKLTRAIFKQKNLEVKTTAIALQDGKEGDIIRLKNRTSGKIFQGLVDKNGQVLVGVAAEENMISLNEVI